VQALTICLAAVLLCCKLGTLRPDAAAPSQFAIGLAVRELLLSRETAVPVRAVAVNATSNLTLAGQSMGKLQAKVSEVGLPAASAESEKEEPRVPPEKGDADGRDAAGAAIAGWDKGKWSLGDWVSNPAHTPG
jgi:hypothetical protein